MPTRKELNQRSPACDVERNAKLRALYEGGEAFRAHLLQFLPQRPHEPAEQYSLRQKEAVYRNYVGPIQDFFSAMLFTSTPQASAKEPGAKEPLVQLPDYYAEFHEDCDKTGTNLVDSVKAQLIEAMTVGKSWFWLQHPSVAVEPTNKADFEKLGIGDSWLTALKDDDVLDWETDDDGNLAWGIVHECTSKRMALSGGRQTITETWYYLTPDRVEVYRQIYEKNKAPKEDEEVPLVAAYPHRYGAVPLICFELPRGLWVSNRLESPQLAHFRLSNMQLWGMSRTCYAMPVFKRDSEESSEPTMGAGYGVYLGIKESLEWAAPPVDCYDALGDEIKSHKDEIYRIGNTMALGVENNAAAVGRSADSKAEDARATSVVMLAFGRVVKETLERIYDLVSSARGDKFEWAIDGLDDFAADDLPGLVGMFEQVESAGGIPSKTFNVELKRRLAESFLPDLPQDKKLKIREELEQGVEDQSAEAKRQREERQLNAIGGRLNNEASAAKTPPPNGQPETVPS